MSERSKTSEDPLNVPSQRFFLRPARPSPLSVKAMQNRRYMAIVRALTEEERGVLDRIKGELLALIDADPTQDISVVVPCLSPLARRLLRLEGFEVKQNVIGSITVRLPLSEDGLLDRDHREIREIMEAVRR